MDGVRVVPHECVQNRSRKLFVDVPVPHTKEKIMESVRVLPQERVQNRVTLTGKVFTVRHHRGDPACAVDTLGLNIKGLDKYNMPRLGDVMVPVPRSPRALWAMLSRWSPGLIENTRRLHWESPCTVSNQEPRA